MLIENTLFGNIDKVKIAIRLLQDNEPQEGYYVCFSGGKDSVVMLDLVKKSGVKYEAYYNVMTVEPPELIQFINQYHSDVKKIYPPLSMRELIIKHGLPPTRRMRYCCFELKSKNGQGRVKITGVRAAESHKRAQRAQIEDDEFGGKFVHVIRDWTEKDIWQYIRDKKIPYCCLYDEGFTRIGCVMCPYRGAKQMQADVKRFPTIARYYLDACKEAYDRRLAENKTFNETWHSGEDMFKWWIGDFPTYKQRDRQAIAFSLF